MNKEENTWKARQKQVNNVLQTRGILYSQNAQYIVCDWLK